ncbi:MAG: signal peptidase II [Candidatus Omnitrophota bacterium]
MAFIIVSVILALDQFTKFLAVKKLALQQSFPVIKGVFHFTLVYNRGAAFGILKNHALFFILASLFAIFLIYLNLRDAKHSRSSVYFVSLSLILAGALGNLIDRICLGYVVDFLDFRIWPVFNLADSAITAGAILLGYSILRAKI